MKTPHPTACPARVALLILAATAAFSAQPVQTTPQSTNPTVVFTGQTTTGIGSPVLNVGQNVHVLSYSLTGANVFSLKIAIVASNDCVNYFRISDFGTAYGGGTGINLITATGFYPCVTAQVFEITQIAGDGVSATYVGTSSTTPISNGILNTSGIRHFTLAARAAGNASNPITQIPLPDSASAILDFKYSSSCTGSTLTITLGTINSTFQRAYATIPLASTTAVQSWILPNFVAMYASITYTPGGGCIAGNLYTADIYFTSAQLAGAALVPPIVPPSPSADFLYNYATAAWEPRLVPTVWKIQSAVALGAGADVTLWTPAGGKSFRLLGFRLSGSLNSPCNLRDNTAGTAFYRFQLPGIPGISDIITVNGYLSTAAGNVLAINCTNALTLDGVVWGVEQ